MAERCVDNGVYNYSSARVQAGSNEQPTSVPYFTHHHVASKPSRHYESRYDGDTFPVIDTTGMTDEQRELNAARIAAIRAARQGPEDQLTIQERAIRRKKEDEHNQRFNQA
jgi:hypothetical protein